MKFRNKQAKVCKNARRSNLGHRNVSSDKIDSPSFDGFHAQLDWLKTQEVGRETLDYVSCFPLHFFRALAASRVLYNRTEHSQCFSIC